MTVLDDVFALFDSFAGTPNYLGIIPNEFGFRIPVQLFRIDGKPDSFVYVEAGYVGYSPAIPVHIVEGPAKAIGVERWQFGERTIVRQILPGSDSGAFGEAMATAEWLTAHGETGRKARDGALQCARGWLPEIGPLLLP